MTERFYRTNQTSASTSLYITVGGLLSITALSAALLSSIYVSADSSSANASVTVPEACTMTSTVDTAHTANIDPGTYKSDGIGQTTISTTCNDTSGYAIYAIGYTGDEYTGTNHTKLVGANSGTAIATGTTHTGDTSYWSMKLTAGTNAPIIDNSYNDFNVVPDTYVKVAHKTSATGSTASTITTTYAAYISSSQVADSYSGKVKYTMVHPNDASAPLAPLAESDCPANKICYAPNASDIVGSMSSLGTVTASATAGAQSTSSNATPTLIAPNYSRSNYGFAGWSPDFVATSSSTIYGPNQTITTSTSGTGDADVSQHGLILYPVWVASTGNLQSWNGCTSLTQASASGVNTLASVTALTDQRDNNTYAVARLSDGHCWMIENLRLDSTNSDNSTGALSQGYGTSATYGNFGGLADTENANFTDSTTANSLYYSGTQDGTASIDIGATNYPDYRMPRYNNNNTNRSLTASYNGTGNTTYYQWYGYGNYYTWHAIIADLTYNGTNNQSTTGTSLCPTGWRLPQGGNKTRIESNDDNDFWNLMVDALNGGINPANYDSFSSPYYTGSTEAGPVSAKLRSYPNNFVYSGYFYAASAYDRSRSGSYWSSTAYGYNSSYYLYLYSSYVGPGTGGSNKYSGLFARCLVGS
ncbi:hypothetical protein IKF20_00445 [Candidatus Saccharibacteria bacterium]|nr:hypothetical protein [Candidatus Saccharibacteria bacterium]